MEELQNSDFIATEGGARLFASGGLRGCGFGLSGRSADQIGFNQQRMNIVVTADGARVSQPFRHRIDRLVDVSCRILLGSRRTDISKGIARQHRPAPRAPRRSPAGSDSRHPTQS